MSDSDTETEPPLTIIPALRLFLVQKSQTKDDTEMVEAHRVSVEFGVLLFETFVPHPMVSDALMPLFKRGFRVWHDYKDVSGVQENTTAATSDAPQAKQPLARNIM
jgi:hypothetical protein